MAIFPKGYTPKATPDGTDVVLSSDAITNFNLTIASIALYTLTNATTTDISEGTNLYYTDARVSANSTVISKADKTNVLEKDNTTEYTPTAEYHPATKGYVDSFPVPSATETIEGVVERATNTEFLTGTDTTRYVNSLQASFKVVPGDTLLIEDVNVVNTNSLTYVKLKEIQVDLGGTYKVEFNLRTDSVADSGVAGRIYVNGVAIGTEQQINLSDENITYTSNFTVSNGDLIQLYLKRVDIQTGFNDFMRIKFNTIHSLVTGTVNII